MVNFFGKKDKPNGAPQPSDSSSLDKLARSFGAGSRWERTTEVKDAKEIVILRIFKPNGDSFSARGMTTEDASVALEAQAAKHRPVQ